MSMRLCIKCTLIDFKEKTAAPARLYERSFLQAHLLLCQPFNNGAVRHAAALAHGLEAIATTVALQFVEEHGHEASARRAEGMTDRNCPAVDVDAAQIGPGLVLPGQDDAGKSLVDLDEIHLVER